MDYFGRYLSDFVRTAFSSLSPNKVTCYTLSQYDTEYSRFEIICDQEPYFYLYKVALHFDMVYVPRMPEKYENEDIQFAYSIFRFQGEEDAAVMYFRRHVEVFEALHTARVEFNLPCDRATIERIATFCREHFEWTAAHIAAALPWPEAFVASSISKLVNIADEAFGKTPLNIAIDTNSMELVEFLLQLPDIKLDQVDHNGDTVLHSAATPISSRILSVLLTCTGGKVNLDALNNLGDTALSRACQLTSRDCVEQLLKAGASPLIGTRELPLQTAVSLDSIECVKLIYHYCPDAVNAQQSGNLDAPLHVAQTQQMFNFLCEHAANLDLQNHNGLTVLHKCVRENDLGRVMTLLSGGADPNLGDSDGCTTLHYVALHSPSVHVLRALLAFEADPSVLNKKGESTRHLICSDASGSYSHSEARDLALYTLHAIGAPRCPVYYDGEDSRHCTEGCINPATAGKLGLELFDGTAPKTVNNSSADPVGDVAEFLRSLTPRVQQPEPVPRRLLNSLSGTVRGESRLRQMRRHHSAGLRTAEQMNRSWSNGTGSVYHKSVSVTPAGSVLKNSSNTNEFLVSDSSEPSCATQATTPAEACTSLTPECRFFLDREEQVQEETNCVGNHVENLPTSWQRYHPESGTADTVGTTVRPAEQNTAPSVRFRDTACSCNPGYLFELNQCSRSPSPDSSQQPSRTSSMVALRSYSSLRSSFHQPPPPYNHSLEDNERSDSDRSSDRTPSTLSCPPQDRSRTRPWAQVPVDRGKRVWSRGPHGLRVLTLDGGGVRGLIHVHTLRTLERLTKRRVTELFDWIVGTSCGGVIALMLLRGKCLRCCRSLLFSFKDNVFSGKRPYCADGLEKILRQEFGEETVMTELKADGNRVAVTTLVCDRCPPILHLFRNYPSPRSIFQQELLNKTDKGGTNQRKPKTSLTSQKGASDNDTETGRMSSNTVFNMLRTASGFFNQLTETVPSPSFKPIAADSEQLVWEAARSTGAAPTFFRPCGRFVDGGLISNNPTLDFLTEYQEMCAAWRLQVSHILSLCVCVPLCHPPNRWPTLLLTLAQKQPVIPLSAVVSLGTGQAPVEAIDTVDVFRPQSLSEARRSFAGFSSIGRITIESATMSNGPVVDRANAWCASLGVPCYRLSPHLSLNISLDTFDTEVLLQMIWEAQVYIYRSKQRIDELVALLIEDLPQKTDPD